MLVTLVPDQHSSSYNFFFFSIKFHSLHFLLQYGSCIQILKPFSKHYLYRFRNYGSIPEGGDKNFGQGRGDLFLEYFDTGSNFNATTSFVLIEHEIRIHFIMFCIVHFDSQYFNRSLMLAMLDFLGKFAKPFHVDLFLTLSN